MLRTIEQERANYAYKCISEVKSNGDAEVEKKYKSYVRNSISYIKINGLASTLAFYKSKSGQGNENSSASNRAYKLLYEHINQWFINGFLHESGEAGNNTKDVLLWAINEKTSTLEVFQLTEEIILFLEWLKRFAEAELKGEE